MTHARGLALLIILMAAIGSFAFAEDETITVWGKLEVEFDGAGFKLPVGTPPGVEVTLRGNGYEETRDFTSIDPLTRKFKFQDVPLDEPMRLTIIHRSATGRTIRWNGLYRFDEPELNVIQRTFRAKKARRMAGYTGDFTVDLKARRIIVESRYER
jgi:hypothetical protein